MTPDDDLTPSLLQAFTDRHLSMAPSGQFLAEQEASDAQAKDAEQQTAARDWLRSKANSIEGGTSEVQLNVIAKRILELPGA